MKDKVNRKNTNELLNQTGIHLPETDTCDRTTEMNKKKTEAGGSQTEPGKSSSEDKMQKTEMNKFAGDME